MWSFDRKTLIDDMAKAQKLISAEMPAFHTKARISTRNIRIEMHRTADFYSTILVSWELMTEGYQG